MDEFNATVTNNRTIEITTNTYWSCKAEGNFKLSKYDGIGDATVDIIIPEDIMFIEGNVYFTYGDERCEFPQVFILFNNECYIKTIPNYDVCETENVVYLFYNEEREVFNMSVFTIGNWNIKEALNCIYLIGKNDLTIIPLGEEGGKLTIFLENCEEKEVVVKLIKRSQKN